MDIKEAINKRHSFRTYHDKPIEEEKINRLNSIIDEINNETGLQFQLITNEPKAFTSFMAKYGNFKNVTNYFVLVGNKSIKNLDEICGYYGEKLVLEAEMMGLNTCWVKLTYKKVMSAYKLFKNEKVVCVISLGYGMGGTHIHKVKTINDVSNYKDGDPEWFKNGVLSALKAPTAVNQQKFYFELVGDKVKAKKLLAPIADLDLGIVKYHFLIGSGKEKEIFSDE